MNSDRCLQRLIWRGQSHHSSHHHLLLLLPLEELSTGSLLWFPGREAPALRPRVLADVPKLWVSPGVLGSCPLQRIGLNPRRWGWSRAEGGSASPGGDLHHLTLLGVMPMTAWHQLSACAHPPWRTEGEDFFCRTQGIIAACIHGLTTLQQGVGVVATSQPRACAHPALKLQLQVRDELTQQRARLSHGQENPRAFNPKSPKPARPLRALLAFIASAPLTYAEIHFCHLPHPLQLRNPLACATELPAALQFAASPPDHGTATSS